MGLSSNIPPADDGGDSDYMDDGPTETNMQPEVLLQFVCQEVGY